MDAGWLQKIAQALRGGDALSNRANQLHAAEAQANGQTPLSPEQFLMQQKMAQMPQQAPASPAQDAPVEPFRF